MDEKEFWVVVYNIDGVEYTDEYYDQCEASVDYVTMCNNDESISYAVLQHVTIDDTDGEIIEEIDMYRRGE